MLSLSSYIRKQLIATSACTISMRAPRSLREPPSRTTASRDTLPRAGQTDMIGKAR